MTYVPNELLSRLVGDRLVAATFVLDSYLQLQFDEAMLNVDVWPAVEYDGRVLRSGDLGYADSLRRLCGETVVETTEASGDGLRVRFNAGQIHINPLPDEVFVEIALLRFNGDSDRPGPWMCWRPGEESFEHLG